MKPPFPKPWLPALLFTALVPFVHADPGANPALFSRSKMQAHDLPGLRVWLGAPVQVTEQIGWGMDWVHQDFTPSWSFIHLTPFLARFPQGHLIATYTLDPDNQDNPVRLSGFQISKDGGAHWGRRYPMLMQHKAMVFIPQSDDSLLGVPSEMMAQSPSDDRNFVGPAYLFQHGGDQLLMTPDGIRVVDWPWPVALHPGPQPREIWSAGIAITGNALQIGNQLLATAYGHKKGDSYDSSMLVASTDGGYTWRSFSTIAAPDSALAVQKGRENPNDAATIKLADAAEAGGLSAAAVAPLASWIGFEGPCETSIVQLADGDLMAVFRVGGGSHRNWNLRRNYSHDGGRTWTKPDALPGYSVWPQLLRSANGALVLATGRPGLDLWFSTDPRGAGWQKVDLVAHHNAWVPDPSYRIGTFGFKTPPFPPELAGRKMWETSSYTALVEMAPNKLLLIYDRDPERAPSGPRDISRVFVLPLEIERR